MPEHKTGTREEWLAARLELLQAEKDYTRRGDELAKQRQELPWVRIEKDYRFNTDQGSASLDLYLRLHPGSAHRLSVFAARAAEVNGV